MTLILSALTQNEVVQVSDRRFTFIRPDGSVRSRNDERNKAVLFCGRVMFGFTGRGDLGIKRSTDLWLADRIGRVLGEFPEADQGTLFRGLAAEATKLFAKAYRGQRHAFVGVGWARFSARPQSRPATLDQYQPYVAGISNFHDDTGVETVDVGDHFSVFVRVLPRGDTGFVLDVPKHLSRSEMNDLTARLRKADRARSVDEVVAILADRVHRVADRDLGVGHGLMISVLPRRALRGSDWIRRARQRADGRHPDVPIRASRRQHNDSAGSCTDLRPGHHVGVPCGANQRGPG